MLPARHKKVAFAGPVCRSGKAACRAVMELHVEDPAAPVTAAEKSRTIAGTAPVVVLPGHRPDGQPRAGLDVKFLCAFAVML